MRLYILEISIFNCWFSLRGLAFLASVNAWELRGNDVLIFLTQVNSDLLYIKWRSHRAKGGNGG